MTNSIEPPGSPAGRQLAWLLDQIKGAKSPTQQELGDRLNELLLESRGPEHFAEAFSKLNEILGEATIVSVDEKGPFELIAEIAGKSGDRFLIPISVEATEPHRISAMTVAPRMGTHIRNIVIACPEGTWNEDLNRWEGAFRDLALFYCELLGMKIIREDWLKIGKAPDTYPQLAFGDGPTENYKPPRWGDPERPQQLHLEIPVNDLDAAEDFALGLGATKLEEKTGYRTYADPIGHPFCFYLDERESSEDGRPLSGRIGRIVFDCFSPRVLADCWGELLQMPIRVEDDAKRVVIAREDGSLPMLGFQHAVFPAPRWPDPEYPQQIHLDLHFDDGKAGQELAERLGAIRMPPMGGSCPVYADPAAHPFCLCSHGQ